MDAAQEQLIKRWDNAKHFPTLPNFPHHIHIGSETNVVPGDQLGIVELLEQLKGELSKPRGVE